MKDDLEGMAVLTQIVEGDVRSRVIAFSAVQSNVQLRRQCMKRKFTGSFKVHTMRVGGFNHDRFSLGCFLQVSTLAIVQRQ
jgi:hypothetical protein